jgi:hypothetical protein
VDVAEGPVAAAADRDTAKAPSLKLRMANIRDECAGFTKDDIKMGSFTIKGHTFEAILSEVRPLLHKHGVDVTPNLVERAYSGNRCDVLVDFTFERTDDSDEERTIRWGGAGTDNGDKAFAKAGTNCVKEMLKKRFLITDRDDAKEEEEKIEHRTEDGVNRAALDAQKEEKRQAVQLWAQAVKMALEKASSLDDIKHIERDNRDQLANPDLPTVTRSFFIDLIERRKKELA